MCKTTYTCDHCGITLDEKKDYVELEVDNGVEYFETDLCSHCFKEFDKIIRDFCGQKKVKEKEREED